MSSSPKTPLPRWPNSVNGINYSVTHSSNLRVSRSLLPLNQGSSPDIFLFLINDSEIHHVFRVPTSLSDLCYLLPERKQPPQLQLHPFSSILYSDARGSALRNKADLNTLLLKTLHCFKDKVKILQLLQGILHLCPFSMFHPLPVLFQISPWYSLVCIRMDNFFHCDFCKD